MGEEQPRADRTSESVTAEPPDVIDLRPHEDAAANGAASRNGVNGTDSDPTARSQRRALTASEGWDWLDLGLRISDAQLDARRTTSRPMNIDRTDVMRRTAANGAAAPATDLAAPAIEPAIDLPAEAATDTAAPSASDRLTRPDWSNWVRLGRKISEAQGVAARANGHAATADSALVEADRAVAEVPEVAAAEVMTAVSGKPRVAVIAVGTAVVLLVAAIAVALAVRDDTPTPSPSARPSASGGAQSPADRSLAVRWLEQNTAAGTRLLVPPELVGDFAAGLPGRQVLPNDQVAARTGDLLVVTSNSGDVLTGTLTQQVLAAAPVVATLPGSDLEVHQVTGPDPSDDAARVSAGDELLQNLGLTFVGGSSALRSGRVDERVLVILAGLASQHSLTVALVPDPADAPDALVRTLDIQGVDGHAVTAASASDLKEFVTAQRGALAGPIVDEVDDGTARQVSVRYLLPASVELLNSGSFPTVSQESR
jgi:hypothetical protein